MLDRFQIHHVLLRDRCGYYASSTDHVLERRVTLRVFGPIAESKRGRDGASRLARELRTLTGLRHPAAPKLYDVLDGETMVAAILEPIEIPHLLDTLTSASAALAIQIARELLGVLAEAHALGVIHRAVTASVLAGKRVDESRGTVKLLGWGRLADLGGVASTTGDGTPSLDGEWAPETILGDHVDERTDVYGVGTVVYRLLTGAPLIDVAEPRPDVVMRELLRVDRSVNVGGGAALNDWVRRALALEPSARFASTREALAALPDLDDGTARTRPASAMFRTRPTPRIEHGRTFGKGYRVLETLGSGGMGTVFLAEDLALERRVAIKLLHDVRPEARDALLTEARSMARVRSSHVARVYGVGEEAGVPFLVMELVEGRSLEEELTDAPQGLPLDRVATLVAGVARGLGDLHALGMVHGDVKPSNVMVAGDHVYLLDFGLARTKDAMSSGGRVAGTPAYMSPERIRGRIDEAHATAADVYAAGVLFHELLTGSLPFEANTVAEVLEKHQTATPLRASSRRPELGPAVDEVLARALAKNPTDRTRDVETLADELVGALAQARSPLSCVSALVAGDDAVSRGQLARVLAEKLDLRAVHQAPSRAAAAVARRVTPDVVLLCADGNASLDRMLRDLQEVPVRVLVVASDEEAETQHRQTGIRALLRRPLDVGELRDAILARLKADQERTG